MSHRFSLRVYYEDTDLAGIVYYANYLKFIERARSEWVRALGIDQAAMKVQGGGVFVVTRVEADYLKPAHFDDWLEIDTQILSARGARVVFGQTVLRGSERLFHADVTVVHLNGAGRPERVPDLLRQQVKTAE